MQKFFSNPGRKIKTFANIIFILSCIATIVIVVIYLVFGFSSGKDLWEYSTFRASYFISFCIVLLILLGGLTLSYLNALFIYGLGELIESSTYAKNKIIEIEQEIDIIGEVICSRDEDQDIE